MHDTHGTPAVGGELVLVLVVDAPEAVNVHLVVLVNVLRSRIGDLVGRHDRLAHCYLQEREGE